MSQSAHPPLPTQRRYIRLLTILGLVLVMQLACMIVTLLRGPGRV